MNIKKKLFGTTASGVGQEPSALWNLLRDPNSPVPANVAPEPPCCLDFNRDRFFWAMRNLPISEAVKGLMICGVTGAGKTIAIRLFLQSIADRFRPDASENNHLIIFDEKRDIIPHLAGMGLNPDDDNFWILNPFDARSAFWPIGEAAQEPAMVRYLASLLVEEEKNSTAPFFYKAARQLARATMAGLNTIAGTTWTLRDLLCALSCEENIKQIASSHPRSKETAEEILNDGAHAKGVIANLWTSLARFEEIAALWASTKSGKVFSVDNFLKRPGVLVLGNDPVLTESIQPLNLMALKMVSDKILRGPETNKAQHFFVFDECPALGKIPQNLLAKLLAEGRSKGSSILIGTQSIEALIELYGEPVTNSMLGQCANKTFLRAGSAQTGVWAENHFSKIRHIETTYSESIGKNSSASINYSLQERSLFLSSVFQDLPFPETSGVYHSISDVPSTGCACVSRKRFDTVLSWLSQPNSSVPEIVPRSDTSEQHFRAWDDAEKKRFLKPRNPASTSLYLPRRRKKPSDPNQGDLFPPNP